MTPLLPGDYEVAGRAYRVEPGLSGRLLVRRLRKSGQPCAGALGRVTPAGVEPFDPARAGELARLRPEHRTVARCKHPGCGRELTDPVSVAAGLGPEHRQGAA